MIKAIFKLVEHYDAINILMGPICINVGLNMLIVVFFTFHQHKRSLKDVTA